jgi:uncharacterized protein YqhQ
MSDSDPIDFDQKKPDELLDVLATPFTIINIKSCFLLFFIFLFVSSNIFINQILYKFNNTVIDGQISTKGIIIQGIFLVMLYVLVQIIIGFDLI